MIRVMSVYTTIIAPNITLTQNIVQIESEKDLESHDTIKQCRGSNYIYKRRNAGSIISYLVLLILRENISNRDDRE